MLTKNETIPMKIVTYILLHTVDLGIFSPILINLGVYAIDIDKMSLVFYRYLCLV